MFKYVYWPYVHHSFLPAHCLIDSEDVVLGRGEQAQVAPIVPYILQGQAPTPFLQYVHLTSKKQLLFPPLLYCPSSVKKKSL